MYAKIIKGADYSSSQKITVDSTSMLDELEPPLDMQFLVAVIIFEAGPYLGFAQGGGGAMSEGAPG